MGLGANEKIGNNLFVMEESSRKIRLLKNTVENL
jgi:hypothetical protein